MILKNIDFLITSDGEIRLEPVGPFRCTAVANDSERCLAMLVREPGESLVALLERLDAAIEDALERDVFVDEINSLP